MALTDITRDLIEGLRDLVKSDTQFKTKNKILLVEDNDNDSELMAELLEREDVTVVITKTKETAETILLSEDIKFVFLDLNLAGHMDGVGVLSFIRENCPKLPVIIVSGFLDNSIFQQIKRLGYFAMIEKPLNKKELDLIFTHFRI